MGFFSLMIRGEGFRAVIIGGGKVAFRKADVLYRSGAEIKVIAPVISENFCSIKCEKEKRYFRPSDVEGADLVIAATDSRKTNAEIAAAAKQKRIPVNVVDSAEESSVIFPAVLNESGIKISVSTLGKSPRLAKEIRDKLKEYRSVYQNLICGKTDMDANTGDRKPFENSKNLLDEKPEAENLLNRNSNSGGNGKPKTENMRVILAGAGIGKADLITLRAAKAVKKADIIIYDSLIDKSILKAAKKNAELIFAGKRRGRHSITQEELNSLLYEKAKTGKLVLRLKGGDPFIFAHGKEEFLYLKKRGVKVKVIPGLTSAAAAPALAGISLTDREKLRCFTVLTGSFKNGKCEYDWEALKKLEGVKVFLMGLANAGHIADKLMKAGTPPSEPSCIIENAGGRGQRHFNCTAGTILQTCEKNGIKSPAIIVIGTHSFTDLCV